MKKSCLCAIIINIIFLITYLLLLTCNPEIYLKGSKEVKITYKDKYVDEGAYASFVGLDISKKIEIENNINYNKVGNYVIIYKISNLFGKNVVIKRNINIIDNDFPIIELKGTDVKLEQGQQYKEQGYKASDLYDGDLTDKVKIVNSVNINKPGNYEIIYKVSDSSFNETIIKRKVIVYEKPVIVKPDTDNSTKKISIARNTDNNIKSVPILTYHNFMTSEEKNNYAKNDKYTMSTSSFEEQLKYLKNNKYNTISLEDFYLWYIGKKKLSSKDVVIVIDDSNISAYKYAIPLIEKYEFQASIFVITGRVTNNEQVWDPTTLKFFNERIITDIRTNHKSIVLASHTHYLHSQVNGGCAIASKNEEEIYTDVKMSKDFINSDFLAYPFGCHTDKSTRALKRAGYKMAFEFGDSKRATKNDDIYAIKRININANISMNQFIKWLEV